MTKVIKLPPRRLRATYSPTEPYIVEREDQEDGSIRYVVSDTRPDSYRRVCSMHDDGGTDPYAKHDAAQIVRGLNLLVQQGAEKLPKPPRDDDDF